MPLPPYPGHSASCLRTRSAQELSICSKMASASSALEQACGAGPQLSH